MVRAGTAGDRSAQYGCFTCSKCGRAHAQGESEYVCVGCGPAGILEAIGLPPVDDKALFTSSPGMWRYERLLALSPDAPRPHLLVGATPLVPAGRLGEFLDLDHLYIKNDALNPTGSLKDRASAVVLGRAAQIGAKRVAVASTGNAGSSLAGLGASMGMPVAVFLPAAVPKCKLIQALVYGAQVFAVQGTYDDAFDLCLEACDRFGWYNRSTALNPYTIEGKKTVAYEIYEQLGARSPDLVFVPTGDGCILSGVARGFRDLRDLGLIARVPRLIAVQAEGSDAIARAIAGNSPIRPINAHSVADSITVDVPRNGAMAVRDVRDSGGRAVVVTDDEILHAEYELAATTGIFAEPAGAASLAGLKAMLKLENIERDATVVLLVTGSGSKDVDAAARSVGEPLLIEPRLESVEKAITRSWDQV